MYYSKKYGRADHCRILSPTSAFSRPAKRASGNTLASRAMVVDQSKYNGGKSSSTAGVGEKGRLFLPREAF